MYGSLFESMYVPSNTAHVLVLTPAGYTLPNLFRWLLRDMSTLRWRQSHGAIQMMCGGPPSHPGPRVAVCQTDTYGSKQLSMRPSSIEKLLMNL